MKPCKTCQDTGFRTIAVERIVGSRRGVHSTEHVSREVPCTDCGAWLARQQLAADTERRKGRTYPMWSEAMGVHPSQVAEAMELDRKLGVQARYSETGQVEFTDAIHRKRYLESHGMYDRNGGHSDPQRGRCRAYDPEYRQWCEKR